jgi:hypothetical protein
LVASFFLFAFLVAFDIWTLAGRCQFTPETNANILWASISLQVLCPLVLRFGYRLAGDDIDGKSQKWIWIGGLMLALAGAIGFREALLYSDIIGEPNWSHSVGLRCGT